jgi:hypothetical protein
MCCWGCSIFERRWTKLDEALLQESETRQRASKRQADTRRNRISQSIAHREREIVRNEGEEARGGKHRRKLS